MNPRLTYYVNQFVGEGWSVISQTEVSASLEKKASSRGLAVLLGTISLFIFFFGFLTSGILGIVCGVVAIIGTLALVALNNATKKSGTMTISMLPDDTVQVSSNIKKLNAIYPPSDTEKSKNS